MMHQTIRSRILASVQRSTRQPGLLLILGAVLVGALLRMVDIGGPFASGDHAEVAAVVSFFYPRDAQAFSPANPTSVWHLLENPHGIVPVTLALIWISLVGAAGITITEFWWNVPFALLGLCSIPLAYRLGQQLGGRLAGILAALFMAILPVHATLSRASGGGSHIAIALVTQLWAVAALVRYYQEPTAQHTRRASLALVCAILTDVLLPVLFFMLLAVGMFAAQSGRPAFGARLQQARKLLFAPQLIRWPLLALAWPVGLLILRAAGIIDYGGLLARLFGGSNRQPGIRLGEFFQNATLTVGPLSLLLLLGCAIAVLPALVRLERRALLLAWSGLYLAPFLFFSRPYVFDFYLLGIAPLVFNAALVSAGWLRSPAMARRLAVSVGMILLLTLLFLRSVNMIFGADFGALVGRGQAAGAVFPDPGLKAAAWWVRAHTQPDALIFADSLYEPYQLAYYLHRPFLGVTDAEQPEEAYLLLDNAQRRPAYYLVRPGNEALLLLHAGTTPRLAATITDGGRALLSIYADRSDTPQVIEVNTANQQFDAQFGSWRTVFAIGTRQ